MTGLDTDTLRQALRPGSDPPEDSPIDVGAPRDELEELRDERQRQVVGRVEAEILERAQRRRLARARDTRDDDELHSTSSRQRRSRASASARSRRS